MKVGKHLAAAMVLAASAASQAAPVQWTVASGGNGHWYEYISTAVDWPTAFAAAQAASFNSQPGYLATITSADENQFASITAANGNLSWLGGSDDGNEGNWTWRNGPETGQAFTYTNWNAGEPNNCCNGENFLQTNFSVALGWNDHGGPGNPQQLNGYIIEYAAGPDTVPEPATAALCLLGLGVAVGLRRRSR